MEAKSSNFQTRRLKPEQAAAAHKLDCHVSVTAGPGAGKTTVLVERYLEILRTQKVSVESIVAITFTNRAANEMRQRVREKIDSLLRTTGGDERRRWLRHKRALESAVITTIHGFCSRLLHEFPVEANIDPQFVLLDEHQAAMMLEAVVEETLTEAIHHNEKVVHMAQGATRAGLAAALVELHRTYRGAGLSLDEIEKQTAANHATDREYFAALNELNARMADLLSARRLSRSAEERRFKAEQEWPQLRAILAEPPTDQTVARYCQAIEDFWEARPRKDSTPTVEPVDELLWGVDTKSDDRLRGKVPSIGFDLLAKDYARALLKLLREIERRLESEKQRLSVLDFDDLQLRVLKLLTERPEVLSRVSERYRFFLVDEFQDTNGLQRDLTKKLALAPGANLFIVGDRKQSIYGFRGADVDVFSEMNAAIEAGGGRQEPLHLNFRSQKALIDSLNFLFERIFRERSEIPQAELGHLGYVPHDASVAERGTVQEPPLVELLVSVLPEGKRSTEGMESDEDDERDQRGPRERDAEQLVERINSLVDASAFRYGDIAILFRALTGAWTYESALRRAGIPYLTVQGKGFYQREEITDLIQLLRFLDNTTDELALAAVLRSPLCGISDNALFALRCAPRVGEVSEPGRLQRRNLLRALRRQADIQFIDEAERVELDRAAEFLDSLIQRRNRYSISELLRFAVASSEFMTVIAANFDGAQRIANIEKLFRLAEQFEKSGQLIRDFVHYVEEFEAIGGREGEGQMDETADAVRLMTIHQAKGLEFPVVIIPDLHRELKLRDAWYVLDRHKGFTVRVPDGRGQLAGGALFNELRQRARWREEFESMRVLYVAATRAEDRLIFSGAVVRKELKNLSETKREQWLPWLWQALELNEHARGGLLRFGDDVQIRLAVDREPGFTRAPQVVRLPSVEERTEEVIDAARPFAENFPLLRPIDPQLGQALRRFSVTQLINFQRCPRQYYFDRMLRAPSAEELAVWNDADAPEPPANLTATLKGAVIHHFCETFSAGDDAESRLRASLEDVLSQRQAELAGRVFQIDRELALRDLMPLAQNYLASDVYRRVTNAQILNSAFQNPQSEIRSPNSEPGLWSELRFRLRRPLGVLTGTIDKLLITPAQNGGGFDVEIIDFKTNRFPSGRAKSESQLRNAAVVGSTSVDALGPRASRRGDSRSQPAQGNFDFEKRADAFATAEAKPSLAEETARDYRLQMQSYALALRELLSVRTGSGPGSPSGPPAWGGGCDRVEPITKGLRINSLRATLHFIDPNIEVSLSPELLEHETCVRAIDEAMVAIASLDGTLETDSFPPMPATHCRICSFLDLCPAGREWLKLRN
jgi:ATP-dependent helicase/nuclease subunit A